MSGRRARCAVLSIRLVVPLLFALALTLPPFGAWPARADVTFTVNSQADAPDAEPGDGDCDADLEQAGHQCTLRAAVMETNALAGEDTIILPAGTYTLSIPPFEDDASTGDLDIFDDLTINGAGAGSTIVDGNGSDRVFSIFGEGSLSVTMSGLTIRNGLAAGERGGGIEMLADGSLTLTDVVVRDNRAHFGGGGIANGRATLTLTNVTIANNHATGEEVGRGGGIRSGSGRITLTNSTISGNTADMEAGGLYAQGGSVSEEGPIIPAIVEISGTTIDDNTSGQRGGGIFLRRGTLTISTSTISNNEADDNGGGIYSENATFTITNSTISGNGADEDGGGIYFASGALDLINVTITNNTAGGAGGGLYEDGDDSDARSTIIAGNRATGVPEDGDCGGNGIVNRADYTIDGDGSCNFDSAGGEGSRTIPIAELRLGPLADNGGPTQTHALLSGSPAIDLVASGCPPPSADQRGVSRPQDGDGTGGPLCDAGAYEAEPRADLSVSKSDSPDPVVVGNDVTYTITVTNHGPFSATSTTVTDTLPEGVTFVSATANPGGPSACTRDGRAVTCNLGTLTTGGPATVTIVVRPPAAGTITNTVQATSPVHDPTPGNNSATEQTTVNAPASPPPPPPSSPPANTPPTISDIPNQTIDENQSTGPLAFTIGDAQTAPGSLTVEASSSNPALVPVGNIILGGSDANRTITVTPVPGQAGTATITVTVRDAAGATASDSFVLTVNDVPEPPPAGPGNTAPRITDIPDQRTTQSTPTRPVRFTIGDAETTPDRLIVTASSSNPRVARNAGLVLRGDGAVRSIQVVPELGVAGRTTITVTVSDGQHSASDSFVLTVVSSDTTGQYDPSTQTFTLRLDNGPSAGAGEAGAAATPGVRRFAFRPPGATDRWRAISGDWNGNGETTTGLYDPAIGAFYLRHSNDAGRAHQELIYRPEGWTSRWLPIAGDWDGDGKDSVGLYDPDSGRFHLRTTTASRSGDVRFVFRPAGANPEWVPLAGDWNGDGRDTIGLYDPRTGRFFLRNQNSQGPAHLRIVLTPRGAPALRPVVGDWNGDGRDSIGLYNPVTGVYRLRNSHTSGPADLTVRTSPGNGHLTPLAGDWNGP